MNELAADIRRDYADKEPVFLPVMTGAFMFSADLLRAIRPPIKGTWVESVKAKSYFGTETTGDVKVNEITVDVKGRHVLLIEDIVDTGLTLEALKGEEGEPYTLSRSFHTFVHLLVFFFGWGQKTQFLLKKTRRETNLSIHVLC